MSPRAKIIVTILVTSVLYVAGVVQCRLNDFGSIGNSIEMLVFFPFSLATFTIVKSTTINAYEFRIHSQYAFAAIQAGVYGFCIGRAWLRGRIKGAAVRVCAAHVAMMLFLIFYEGSR